MISKLVGEFPRPRTIVALNAGSWAILSAFWIYRAWTAADFAAWFSVTAVGVAGILFLAVLSSPPGWLFGTRVVIALRCAVIVALLASAIRFRSVEHIGDLAGPVAVTVFCSALVSTAWLLFRSSGKAQLDLRSPVAAELIVVQGGRFGNHHKPSAEQRWAADLLALGPGGRRASRIVATEAQQCVIYGMDVHAPCDGVVVECGDGRPDNLDLDAPPAFSDARGNFVSIRTGDDVTVLLAHLQRDSVAVQVGDRVVAGQLIGRCGNSGRTTEPHVHLHCEVDGTGVPFTVDGQKMFRGARLHRR
ncbi:hypothetical protein GOARA_051_00430 [Gordonia araii NBRC 100433]|uniref:M23ase beta-sheet core domain-containing protein n=1 Tax=Gordonia araii NBRC 100433 TaxID=1073574 RepID=G7H2M4_9ACTN|nr:M23 family metallopeptidase [Gordonia araii]NNG97756.1 M23 family metallopeptidase [Gordonia araii NBRC 100433]GAB10099.1 hypothetical protein GOARA_051_00430 [Gordonia araii NBRC 100433]